ncbi:MAG: hypothetical protein IKL48_03980 [Elusimicrobiaceae bacterium]|nr:hypothetical protein [Elusimicrobiaceae bacterium]
MKIDNVIICCASEWDGLPIKSKLPDALKARLKTEEQWFDDGYVLKENAVSYEMHPAVLSKKTCAYYLDIDVELMK